MFLKDKKGNKVVEFKTWENPQQLELFAAIRVTNPPGWPPYTKTAYHTIPYNKNHYHTIPYIKSYNFYTFSKNNEKVKPFLRLFENSWTVVTKKNWFEIFLKKMLTIQFPYTTQKFFSNFENLPQKFFLVFFNRKSNFVRKQTFSEKKFCMHNLIFLCNNFLIILASFFFT